ncbi:DUF6580 family putative transport protein, partial [Thermoplasmatota archaeon]
KLVKQFIGFLLLVFFAIFGRYALVSFGLQPFPNFEFITIAMFLGVVLFDVKYGMLIPIIGIVISDLLLGNSIFVGNKMNQIVIFTYSGFALITLISISLKNRLKPNFSSLRIHSVFCIGGIGVFLVFLYDVWTNLGWWYIMFPHTLESLVTVYLLGIPFMIYHLISGVTTFVFIGFPLLIYIYKRQVLVKIAYRRNNFFKKNVPAVLTTVFLIIISFSGCLSISENQDSSQVFVDNVSMKIISPNWNISYENVSSDNVTVGDLLFECGDFYNFTIESEYYEDFDSLYITSINDIENGADGLFWQYYVNNDYGNVGCSNYNLKNSDFVEWRYEIANW